MTRPGYVHPPQPGWWVRKDRIGVNENETAWDTATVGETPLIRFRPNMRPANPNVGPMALRNKYPRKPQASRSRISPQFDSVGTEKHGTVTANGSFTIAHTIGANATALVVWMNVWTDGYVNTRATGTIGSSNLTALDYTMNYNNDGSLGGCMYLLTLLNPPTGSQTSTITFNNNAGVTNYVSANSFAYTGVAGFGTITKGNVGTATPSLAVAATPGDLIFNGWADYSTSHASYNKTSRWSRSWTAGTGMAALAGDTVATSTSTTFSTAQTATTHCILGLPLQPIT